MAGNDLYDPVSLMVLDQVEQEVLEQQKLPRKPPNAKKIPKTIQEKHLEKAKQKREQEAPVKGLKSKVWIFQVSS